MTQSNLCSGAPRLIFACSGAADVGEVSDRAARKVTREGAGKMFCMTGIGGRVEGILKTTGSAARVVAVDGCPLNCAKRSLEEAGFTEFRHVQLAAMGMEKGKSPASDERVEQAAEAIRREIRS